MDTRQLTSTGISGQCSIILSYFTAAQSNDSKPGPVQKADLTLVRNLLPQWMWKMQTMQCAGPQPKWSDPSKQNLFFTLLIPGVYIWKGEPFASYTQGWKRWMWHPFHHHNY